MANRTKETAHYVIARAQPEKLGATKLNKSMWVADVLCYMQNGHTITGQHSYKKLQNGPVPNGIVACLKALIKEGKIVRRDVPTPIGNRHEYVWLEEPPVSVFSSSEIDLLNRSINWVCNNHTANSISKWTHDALWEETPMGQQISIVAASVNAIPPETKQLKWALARSNERI